MHAAARSLSVQRVCIQRVLSDAVDNGDLKHVQRPASSIVIIITIIIDSNSSSVRSRSIHRVVFWRDLVFGLEMRQRIQP